MGWFDWLQVAVAFSTAAVFAGIVVVQIRRRMKHRDDSRGSETLVPHYQDETVQMNNLSSGRSSSLVKKESASPAVYSSETLETPSSDTFAGDPLFGRVQTEDKVQPWKKPSLPKEEVYPNLGQTAQREMPPDEDELTHESLDDLSSERTPVSKEGMSTKGSDSPSATLVESESTHKEGASALHHRAPSAASGSTHSVHHHEYTPPLNRTPLPKIDSNQFAIIRLYAMHGRAFEGRMLLHLFQKHKLKAGRQKIFHLYSRDIDAETNSYRFSVCNGIKPGTLDAGELVGDFHTPLLLFFFNYTEVSRPAYCFDEMVRCVEQFSDELGGKLYCQDKTPLSRQKVAYLRDEIARYQHRQVLSGLLS